MQPTESILVVDDEPTIVDLVVEILTDEGYTSPVVGPRCFY